MVVLIWPSFISCSHTLLYFRIHINAGIWKIHLWVWLFSQWMTVLTFIPYICILVVFYTHWLYLILLIINSTRRWPSGLSWRGSCCRECPEICRRKSFWSATYHRVKHFMELLPNGYRWKWQCRSAWIRYVSRFVAALLVRVSATRCNTMSCGLMG